MKSHTDSGSDRLSWSQYKYIINLNYISEWQLWVSTPSQRCCRVASSRSHVVALLFWKLHHAATVTVYGFADIPNRRSRNYSNCFLANGLVKRSDMFSFVGILDISIVSPWFSRRKLCFIAMCLQRSDPLLFWAISTALWLSQNTVVGFSLVSMSSSNRLRIHSVSLTLSVRAIVSASHELRAVVFCLLDLARIGQLFSVTT